ncbi:MAG: heat shock protein HspQ [Alphaproteobacteria bacterium]|jgi:heat shock protein HspQ|nr:heat shock protein HspQ [Alphaproteobacteria bacterium]|tara:strand:- start:37 stop:363 length:327 start_codon:yes stop_codon:yes gene_type:complete
MIVESQFAIGDIVVHTKYHFRAVIVNVEYDIKNLKNYNLIKESIDFSEDLVDLVWYKLLIDNGEDLIFVPETMIVSDSNVNPVQHPLLNKYLKTNTKNGTYITVDNVH